MSVEFGPFGLAACIMSVNKKSDRHYFDTVQKIHLCISKKGVDSVARRQSQFPHSCFCERFIYSQDRSTYFPAAEQADPSWEYVNRSQTHECGN
jgi:hypothetical protein